MFFKPFCTIDGQKYIDVFCDNGWNSWTRVKISNKSRGKGVFFQIASGKHLQQNTFKQVIRALNKYLKIGGQS